MNEEKHFTLEEEKDFEFEKHFILCLAAPRRSGKSWFTKGYLKKYHKDYDHIFILSPSLDVNDDYDDFKENKKFELISAVDESVMNRVFNDCYSCKKETKKLNHITVIGAAHKKRYRAPNVLVILDDIVDSSVVNFGGVADKFAERGRHVNMSVIISAQRITAISRSIRLNSDYFIIFSPFAITEVERFSDEFVPKRMRQIFRDEILKVIFKEPYQFLVVDAVDKDFKVSNAEDLLKGKYKRINID